MSIAVMKEGDVMGRGVPPDRKMEAKIRARLRARSGEMVAIFGAGPAGLLAAHAVALAGREPVIISSPGPDGAPRRSAIGPATYLHKAIPDLTGPAPDANVLFLKKGTRDGYALKVYGDRTAPCSWDRFEDGERPAWNLATAYDRLWERYVERIIPMEVTPKVAVEILDDIGSAISTVPLTALCVDGQHQFPFRTTYTVDEFTDAEVADNLIVYDGFVGGPSGRIRTSRIFGREATEYVEYMFGSRPGVKVLPTTCDCHPEIVRAGRWGEWMPGILVHHAFEKVWALMFDNFEGS